MRSCFEGKKRKEKKPLHLKMGGHFIQRDVMLSLSKQGIRVVKREQEN